MQIGMFVEALAHTANAALSYNFANFVTGREVTCKF